MLEIKDICKSYYGNPVLKEISFCLPAGSCIGIIGENGSGKSTLLRVVAQVEQPDGGEIRYKGKSVLGNRKFLRCHVGYVPQDADLMEELTVRSQLMLWKSACDVGGPLPEAILDLLGIHPLLRKKIQTLSGGMKRRVSIAMALLNNPDILIMDEATAGLDRDYREKLVSWIEGYLDCGGRVIWCSHNEDELKRLCGGILRLGE